MLEISELLGTILGTKDIIEIHRDFANFEDFTNFHVYVDHPNGTQVVPKILESKNMMLELSKTLSNVPIGFLDVASDECTFLEISKFSFVSQIFQKLKSANPGRKFVPSVCF